MKYLLLLPLLFIITLPSTAVAQSQQLSGKVVAESAKPIPYATIAVYALPDSSLANGTSTGDKGQFKVSLKPGDYYVKISYLSFASKTMQVAIENEPVNLGTITLKEGAQNIDEVVVEEERSEMELKLDKKVFNVGKDLGSSGSNASEILENVPSVSVDVEGNVSLRGSQGVRILINGKPSGLVSSGDPQSLRQLQGSMIEKIEVITNPSAKYDAEGEVGIINIILKKENKKDLNGSFDINGGYPHDYGAGMNINYRRNGVNLFLSESASWDQHPGGGWSEQLFTYPDTTYSYREEMDQQRSDFSNNLRMGADFYITNKDVLTVSGIYKYSTGENTATTTYKDFNHNEELTQTVTRKQDEREVEHEIEFDMAYEKKFETKDRKWTIDAKYSLDDDTEDAEYIEDSDQNGVSETNERSSNIEDEWTFLLQTDYVHPFGNEGKIETGLKANLREIDNDYTVERQVNGTVWETLPLYNNQFLYNENIYATYLSASEEFGNLGLKAGLRTEYSDITSELVETDENNPRNYIDFFPSAFISYNFTERTSLQLSYSRRINRPHFWNLVPFFSFQDSRSFFSGNPNLDPEYTHSFELSSQHIMDKGNILGSVYYRYRTSVHERVTTVDSTGFTRSFPVNLATEDNYGAELSGTYNIAKWWRANATFNFYRAITDGDYKGESFFSDTYTWRSRASTKVTIAQLVDVQASLRYRGPRETTQGRRKSSYSINLGASMDVLSKKGTITLSARDIFNTRKRRYITETDNFRREGEFQWRSSQSIRLSFNYRLNNDSKRGGRGGGNYGGGR